MRKKIVTIVLAALLVCVFLTSAAPAEGVLAGLWNSGCGLLFETDNVTVDGEAVFELEGERFKTAQLHYVQDGYSSFYGLKLLTPRADGTDRETGWIIIEDQDGFHAVMETYEPGIYRKGTDSPEKSLLRRTVEMDMLTQLGGTVAGMLDGTLPEGTVTAEETEGGKTVHVVLAGEQIPELAAGALNLAAGFLSDRWFNRGYDRRLSVEGAPFESYFTVTQALTDGTVRWILRDADVTFSLDPKDRITAAGGSVRVGSVYRDGTQRDVTVRFEMTVTDYGESHVEPFDPDLYNVRLPREYYGDNMGPMPEMTSEEWDALIGKALSMLKGEGHFISAYAGCGGWIDEAGRLVVRVDKPEGGEYLCAFSHDGRLLSLECGRAWAGAAQTDPTEADAAAAEEKLLAFLREQNPLLAENMGALKASALLKDRNGQEYLRFDAEDGGVFVVRIRPEPRVEEMHVSLSAPGGSPEALPAADALPAYFYTGDDPVEAAVAEYIAGTGSDYLFPQGAVTVPAPVILKIEERGDTELQVYGNYWVFNYVLKGSVLECVSGGEMPAVITLTRTGDGWDMRGIALAGDGEEYVRDIRAFCNGDEALEEMYYASSDALQDPVKSVRERFLRDYVTANQLAADAYRDVGWDQVPLFPAEEP